jgi:NAD(P)-dependent dehydrogenase (short-subunit alcohol dehydrogenase family)
MSLAGKVAVITGGASGIGRSICLRLARDGADIAVFDLNRSGAQQTAHAVEQLGRRATAIGVDVANATHVRAALAEVRRQLGPVQILVNDAGICEFAPFVEMSEALWDRMIAVHVKGAFHCARAVIPDMQAANWGRIVNLSSVAGLNGGGPGLVHYATAKAAIIGFTKSLAREIGPLGITVNAIAPGLIDTPMIRAAKVPEAIIQRTATETPMRRVGIPDDIAAACAYLVSSDASFLTGQVISPNGGTYL